MIKLVAEMSLQELAAYVATHLKSRQLPVVLVGGSCVSIYSNNKYQTKDLDFVERYHNQRSLLRLALQDIGFIEQHRYFVHPDAHYFLEFPLGPLAVGDSPVNELNEVVTETGVVTLLTAQDCICDRLSAYTTGMTNNHYNKLFGSPWHILLIWRMSNHGLSEKGC